MIKILQHVPKVMLILMIICSVLAYILNSHELLAGTFCGMLIFIMVYLVIVAILEINGLLEWKEVNGRSNRVAVQQDIMLKQQLQKKML